MTSTINQQTARRKADQRLRAENKERYAVLMQEEHERMGLEYKPRLSAEERQAQRVADEKGRAVTKIKAMAAKAGIGVVLVEDPDIEAKIKAVQDGTAEPGVTVDWHAEATDPVSAEDDGE